MKKIFIELLLFLSLFTACDRVEVDRTVSTHFFSSNTIYAENARLKFEDTLSIHKCYTGNDTIAFGKQCVILWQQIAPDKLVMSFLHEDRGKVYVHASSEFAQLNPEWTLLYDFSVSPWKIGDKIWWNKAGEQYIAPIVKLGTVTLGNGEKVQIAEDASGYRLIYGLGYEECVFFGTQSGMLPQDGTRYVPVSFYRNGDLIWPHR